MHLLPTILEDVVAPLIHLDSLVYEQTSKVLVLWSSYFNLEKLIVQQMSLTMIWSGIPFKDE